MQLNPAKMARPVHADGRRYVPAIDGLRCLAAWGVISAHIGSEFGPSHKLVAYYGAAAYPALIVFFTISGFLVYRPFARAALAPHTTPSRDRSTKFWVYILRRVLRIFPLYWTVLAAAIIWNGPGNLHGLTDWVQAIFLLPVPNPMRLLAGPLGIAMWTLAIELPFYVVVPLYSAGVKALRARFAPDGDVFRFQVLCVSVVIAFILSLGLIFSGELAFPVMSLPIGMLLALLETRQALARRRYPIFRLMSTYWYLCIAAYVGLVFVAARLALDAYDTPGVTDPYDHIRNVYFPIQLTLALLLFIPVAFGARRSLFVRLMASTPLQMLAPLTYGVYLWHVPLIHHTQEWFGRGFLGFPVIGTKGFGMPTIFIAIGLAIATFVLVELPAAKLRERVDRWSRGQAGSARDLPSEDLVPATVDSEDDVELGEAGSAADVLVDDVEELAEEVPELVEEAAHAVAHEYRGVHRAIGRAGATTDAKAAAEWCQPIDGFRAICACLAVMGHTFLASGIFPFSGALHVMGILVALFFAISAFVLYQPFIEADATGLPRPRAWSFYVRRLLRIYPLFAFALTMYLIVLPEVRPDNLWGYARLYLFLQIFGHELSAFKGLPSAWYLCNEVIFYLLMPVMAFAAARWSDKRRLRRPENRVRAHIAMGWGMVFFGPLLRTVLYNAEVAQPTSLPLSHLEFFGFGVVIAGYTVGARLGMRPPALIDWLARNAKAAYAMVLVPAVLLALIAVRWGDGSGLWSDGGMEDRLRFFPYLAACVLLMSAAALGSPRDPVNRWLSAKRFKPLSGLALHIYLWHQLVLGIINAILDSSVGGIGKLDLGTRFVTGAVLVAVALGGTIVVAWVSQPFTDWPYERFRARHGLLRRGGMARERPRPTRRPAISAS